MENHLDYEINKELGECYLFMGDLDKAEDYYRKAASSNGVHPDPYLGLATIAIQRGALDDAYAMYAKAASIQPSDKALAGMAMVLMENGRHEEAYGYFQKALDGNPQNIVALHGFLQEGFQLDRLDEVVARMRVCLELQPDQQAVRFALAGCLATQGCVAEARKELETLLSINPAHAEALELYEELLKK